MALGTTNITTTVAKSAIGETTNSVAALCNSDKINPHSRYKPAYYGDGNDCLSGYPKGKLITGDACRLGDFRGYNHSADSPLFAAYMPSPSSDINVTQWLEMPSNEDFWLGNDMLLISGKYSNNVEMYPTYNADGYGVRTKTGHIFDNYPSGFSYLMHISPYPNPSNYHYYFGSRDYPVSKAMFDAGTVEIYPQFPKEVIQYAKDNNIQTFDIKMGIGGVSGVNGSGDYLYTLFSGEDLYGLYANGNKVQVLNKSVYKIEVTITPNRTNNVITSFTFLFKIVWNDGYPPNPEEFQHTRVEIWRPANSGGWDGWLTGESLPIPTDEDVYLYIGGGTLPYYDNTIARPDGNSSNYNLYSATLNVANQGTYGGLLFFSVTDMNRDRVMADGWIEIDLTTYNDGFSLTNYDY